MIYRTGIWRLDQWKGQPEGSRTRAVSLALLRDAGEAGDEFVSLFEEMIRTLGLNSGVHRTTYKARFADLDEAVNGILKGLFPAGGPIEVHDCAASDCLAASEWAESLGELFPSLRFVASDLLLHLVELARGEERFIFEPDGGPLQYIWPPFVVSIRPGHASRYPVNRLLTMWGARRAGRLWPGNGWRRSPISLVHPKARELQARDARFGIVQHSVFSVLPQPCDVIRCMNLFSRANFDERTLVQGSGCMLESLREGGVYITGRTTEETRPVENRATVFRKVNGAFEVVHRQHGGAEIEELVLAASLRAV